MTDQDHPQEAGARSRPRRWLEAARRSTWVTTLALAALLYVAVLLVLKWDFWPDMDVYALDMRWPVCSSVDKLDELKSSQEMGNSLGRDLEQLYYFYSGQPVSPKRMDFNPLPKVIIWLLSQALVPVAAYNVALVVIWLLNGLVLCALVLYLTRARIAALLAGLVFAFSPFLFSVQHCRSLDYGMFFLVPLCLLLLALARDRRGWGWPVALGAALAALVYSHQYYALGMALLGVPWLVLVLVSPGARGRRHVLLRLLTAGLCALALAGPWVVFEYEMLQIQQAMEARGSNMGRSFFRALSMAEDMGLAWTLTTGGLAAAGLLLYGRAQLGLRIVYAACAVLLLWAQHYISSNAEQVALLMQDTFLWRVRACRLSGTLVVCLMATLAGVGFAALWERLRWRWARAGLALAAAAGCVMFLAEDLRWWERMRSTTQRLEFPAAAIQRIGALNPTPYIYAVSLTPRRDIASYAATFLEIQVGASRGFGETERYLQRAVRKGMGLPAPRDGHRGGVGHMSPADDLKRTCTVVVVRTLVGRDASASPNKVLAGVGFTGLLHPGGGWTIAHNRACNAR